MTGNIAIDVAIGLVFIFLLYSLLASIVTEMIASFLGLRARNLHKGIVRMLEEEKEGFFKEKWIFVFNGIRDAINDFIESFSRFKNSSNYNATEKFYDYPLVKYLGRDRHFSKPSYISRQTFSKVIIDLLKKGEIGSEIVKIQEGINSLKEDENNILKHKEELKEKLSKKIDSDVVKELIEKIRKNNNEIHGGIANTDNSFEKLVNNLTSENPKLKKIEKIVEKNYKGSFISGDTLTLVESFLNDSNNDIEKFKILLENWFDTTMERTASWYKRKNQFILMIIGFVIAVSFNVSTIEIANKLSKDDKAREQMVQLATTYVKENPDLVENIQKLITNQKIDDSLKPDINAINTKLDSLLNIKEKLNEDINKANNILGFSLPDKIELKKIEKDVTDKKISSLDSIKTPPLKPNEKFIKDLTNIYIIEFPSKYIKEHAAPYYVIKKKNWWDYFKESFFSNEKGRNQNIITQEDGGKSYLYLDKGKYFWGQFWGYLLTALAISLGATFWFDLLNKLIKLRSSVQQASPSTSKKGKGESQQGNIPINQRVG